MKCCPCCFGDRMLSKIIPSLSNDVGTCSYCGSTEVSLVEPTKLADAFSPLISVYEPTAGAGALLVEWMRSDWGLFEHERMDIPSAKSLLADVLDDGEIVRRQFAFSSRYHRDGLHLRWEKLRDELMYMNRYFPEANLDRERLEGLLAQLQADEIPLVWYRARIQQGADVYPIGEMGAPPNRVTSHGRANPPGIPYLYLGSEEETAISEIRPHTGEIVCVADFTLPRDLRLVDLRNPRRLISPFLFGDEDQIASIRNDIPFIERLGQELTRPVLPQGAAIDYVPSQYLCEFIKKSGYDGVIYSSSVSHGMNLALFDPNKASSGVVHQRRVTRVSVSID